MWFYFYPVAQSTKRGIMRFLDRGVDITTVEPEGQGLRICGKTLPLVDRRNNWFKKKNKKQELPLLSPITLHLILLPFLSCHQS